MMFFQDKVYDDQEGKKDKINTKWLLYRNTKQYTNDDLKAK